MLLSQDNIVRHELFAATICRRLAAPRYSTDLVKRTNWLSSRRYLSVREMAMDNQSNIVHDTSFQWHRPEQVLCTRCARPLFETAQFYQFSNSNNPNSDISQTFSCSDTKHFSFVSVPQTHIKASGTVEVVVCHIFRHAACDNHRSGQLWGGRLPASVSRSANKMNELSQMDDGGWTVDKERLMNSLSNCRITAWIATFRVEAASLWPPLRSDSMEVKNFKFFLFYITYWFLQENSHWNFDICFNFRYVSA